MKSKGIKLTQSLITYLYNTKILHLGRDCICVPQHTEN